MKTYLFSIIMILMGLQAQEYTSETHVSEMKKLHMMLGQWEGDSWAYGREGKQTATVKESIKLALDGTALLVEGKGFNGEKVVHHALGIITYNQYTKKYAMNSFLSSGQSTSATMEIIDAQNLIWYFETPNGMKFKYEVKNDGQTWEEKGFIARDGKTFTAFMGMILKKVK